ncbi:MAG: TolC family protein [Crocinitomicaceae bacterium]|nr:TolC family protein [Crocinitomicaceae bacterium]
MDKSILHIGTSILFTVLISLSSNAQSLDSVLMMAVENNPELKALRLEYEAEVEKKNQVSAWKNPELGVGIPALRPETRLGPQIMMVGAKQMFPWLGTTKSKENVAIAMAKSKYERISALKLDLFQTIKSAYYELCLIDRKLDIVLKNTEVCHSMETIALSKVESGQGSAANVLQSQLRIKKHHHDLDLLDVQKRKFYSIINVLINQDVTTPILVEDTFTEPVEIEVNLEAYRAKIKEHHPLIVEINNKIEVSQFKQEVNRIDGKPTFGIGVDYALVSERTDANPTGNGRDILIPKVMLSIPLYRKKYDSRNKQEDLNQLAFDYKKQSIEDKMIGMISAYQVEFDQTKLHIEFIEVQIEITRQAYNMTLAMYSTEGGGFTDLLQLGHDLINYQLELEESIIETYKIQARIDRLTDF